MNQETIKTQVEGKYLKQHPNFSVGDTIAVSTVVREGDKKRIQIFKGIVISIKGSGLSKSFIVRKISSGVGVEKILPLNSPNVSKIEVLRRGAVRKAKLFYMRKRIGKKALKVNEAAMTPEDAVEEVEVIEEKAAATGDTEAKAE